MPELACWRAGFATVSDKHLPHYLVASCVVAVVVAAAAAADAAWEDRLAEGR